MPGALPPWIVVLGASVRRAHTDIESLPPNIAELLKVLEERKHDPTSQGSRDASGAGALPSRAPGRAVRNINVAEQWRQLAKEARAVGDELTDPDAKRIMLRIAEGYARRAEEYQKSSN